MRFLCLANDVGLEGSGGSAQISPRKKLHRQSHLVGIAPDNFHLSFGPAALMAGCFQKPILRNGIIISVRKSLRAIHDTESLL